MRLKSHFFCDDITSMEDTSNNSNDTVVCFNCGQSIPQDMFQMHTLQCIFDLGQLIPISFLNVYNNGTIENAFESEFHQSNVNEFDAPITNSNVLGQVLDVLNSNMVAHQQYNPFVWINLNAFSIPYSQISFDNTDEYEYNTMIGDLLGKVELGLSDEDIERVSELMTETSTERCPICLETYQDTHQKIRRLNCGHMYCDDCIKQWLRKHKKCPCCQTDLEDAYLKPPR